MTHATAIDDLLAHASWAHALARRLVEDQAAADDVVQELWLAALRRPPERDRPLRPWIAGVVRKLAGRRRRTDVRRDARERAAAQPEAGVAAADEPVARAEAQRMLVEAVLALEEPYRATVLRRYFDGLEPAAIAAADGVPAGTVRWRLAAAREQLRQRLDAGHGHDARMWVLNLLPIATLGAPRPAVLLTSLLGSSAVGGLVTMKMFWNAAAIVLLSLLAWVGLNTMATVTPLAGTAGDGGDVSSAAVGIAAPDPAALPAAGERTAVAVDTARPQPIAAPPTPPAVSEAWIRLRAVDDAGRPVAGVELHRSEDSDPDAGVALGRSDAGGTATLTIVRHPAELTSIGITLSRPGFASAKVRTNVRAGQRVDLGDVELAPGAHVRGVVVSDQGIGVAGAAVRAEGSRRPAILGGGVFVGNGDGSGEVLARTDESGRFELHGVILGRQTLHAELGHVSEPTWLTGAVAVDVPAMGLDEARIVIGPRSTAEDTILVRVRDPDGDPVPFAQLRLISPGTGSAAMANADGEEFFRPPHYGPFVAIATDPQDRYLPVRVTDVRLGTVVDVQFAPLRFATVEFDFARTPAPTEVELTLESPPRTLLGALFGGPEGRSLGSERISTDAATGRGRFRVPGEPFVITATAAGHLPATSGSLDPNNLAAPLRIRLDAARQARGRVLDAAGGPLAGVEVALFLRCDERASLNGFPIWIERDAVDTTRTDADGSFALDWRADRVARVRAVATAPKRLVESADLQPDSDAELELVARPAGAIAGRILGRAEAGIVVACSRGDGYARTVRTDAEGRYRFDDLLPGDYRITLREDELHPHEWARNAGLGAPHASVPTDCRVLAGEVTVFDVRAPAVGSAHLLVTIDVPGLDLAGAIVEAVDATAEPGSSPPSHARSTLQTDGTAELRELATGAHRVLVRHAALSLDARLELRDGENRLQIAAPATGAVRVTGLPPKTARDFLGGIVFVTCELANASLRFAVSGEGECTLRHVPAGTARLDRYPTEEELRTAAVGGEPDLLQELVTLRTFTVPAGGEIKVAW